MHQARAPKASHRRLLGLDGTSHGEDLQPAAGWDLVGRFNDDGHVRELEGHGRQRETSKPTEEVSDASESCNHAGTVNLRLHPHPMWDPAPKYGAQGLRQTKLRGCENQKFGNQVAVL